MKKNIKLIIYTSLLILSAAALALTPVSCSGKKISGSSEAPAAASGAPGAAPAGSEKIKIAVFIPGVAAGSPTYEMLASGVKKAVDENPDTDLVIIEAGFNQGDWENKLTALTGTMNYKYIITSNPAMPEICRRVSKIYPDQTFIVLDGHLEGNKNIYTFLFNNFEQAYLIGVMGALITTSDMSGADRELKVGLIAGQEYPMMNQAIKPGFEKGLKSINSSITVDFRIVGNWYDASKGAELANQMYSSGVDVILSIAGGAGQGVLASAKERKKYVLWFDSNGYDLSEGQVAGCSVVRQDAAAYEITKKAISGVIEFGKADVAGVKEGYVYFIDDDPIFINLIPENLRNRIKEASQQIAAGNVKLEMPVF